MSYGVDSWRRMHPQLCHRNTLVIIICPFLYVPPDAAPTSSTPSLPAPFLSVQPGTVKKGDVITFRCLIGSPLPQYQHSSRSNNEPMNFLLLRTAERTGVTSISSELPARQSLNPAPLPGVFSVGPVMGEEEGEYSCVYQISTGRGRVNSTVSNKIRITITGKNVSVWTPW